MIRSIQILICAVALLLVPATVFSQAAWPAKPVRLVVPYPPGASGDLIARELAPRLAASLGGQFVVENRPGANAMIGVEHVAKSAPDGHTFLIAPGDAFTIIPNLRKDLPYTDKDFEPITALATIDIVLMAHPAVPANTLQELVNLAKANPGSISYGTTGIGSIHHLSVELLKKRGDFDVRDVPYKGTGPAIPDLISGEIKIMFIGTPGAIQLSNAGRAKPLAIGSATRAPTLPNVPTIAESGFPGFENTSYWGLFAPADVPRPIFDRMYQAVVQALRTPDLRGRLLASGLGVMEIAPRDFAERVRADREKWANVITSANIRLEK